VNNYPQQSPRHQARRGFAKRQTRDRLIDALTSHHQYENGSCLNPEPIGNNDLALMANVSRSTASEFFKREFRGHSKYKLLCRRSGDLVVALKLLNNEFPPYMLYAATANAGG
jgi:hypothetical protein